MYLYTNLFYILVLLHHFIPDSHNSVGFHCCLILVTFAAGIVSKGVNDIINNFIVAPLAVPRWGYISFEWVPVTGSKVYHNIIVSHPDGGKAEIRSDTDPALVHDQWISMDLPLSAFTGLAGMANLAQLVISGDPGTAYIDNVYFHK